MLFSNLDKVLFKRWAKLVRFSKKEPLFSLLVFSIVVLSIFFRTYNYEGRVYLQADNSQHVQLARYAQNNFKLPLAGPFSSAGPFHYGPWYFWFLEVVSFLPLGFLTPWYIISSIYLVFIALIFYLGREIGGKWVGGLSALFAAISPAQIDGSFTAWSPAIIPILVLLSLLCLNNFNKRRRHLDIFLLGFIIGLSITIHFQSFLLVPTILMALILVKRPFKGFIKFASVALLGFVVPFLPLIALDSQIYWYNFKSIFVYFAIDQYNSWVPNRWLTYMFNYWPDAWAFIIGGDRLIAFAIGICLLFFSLLGLKDYKKRSGFYLIAITFLLEVIIYRYYRGQRFQYYSLFAQPTIFILTGWGVYALFKFKKILGFILFLLIFVFTVKASVQNFKDRGLTLADYNEAKNEIYAKYPARKFNIFGCYNNPNSVSHAVALLMYYDGRDEIGGQKIGLCEYNGKITWQPIEELTDASSRGILWYERSTEKVYFDTAEWFLKTPPVLNNNFWDFLKIRLNPKCYPHC